ncbi:supernatant protein factor, C-terminal domain-containing protein [Jaminaea rosea]|uniref:Supernatant protein factor, C-terminal domain-containing protein n=1 Tax=Jaminaea rosea TaxID=1569628 RepID=A0A316UWZ9_9BASI|nr:supernatant protein factor, C-terminal domain-containing protein [Jaminaea rosea]PWN29819.1 supernatant protein factor, C-terminal domain-containing protein [Jaminaea rosea]
MSSSRSPSMARLLFIAACLILACLSVTRAHMIELPPSQKECFYEDLNPSDQMTLTYQVGGGGHLDIDVWLDDPNNARLFEQRHKDTGTYSFTATHSGRYTYCFSNEFSTVSDKTLSFNVHGIIYVADEGEMLPIEREIRDLAAGLQAVKDEHEYMVIRERTHRNTAESTNSRVKWWSIIQGFMLLGVCAVQVVFVKRHFEVRRAI